MSHRATCPQCGRNYVYDLAVCSFCRVPLERTIASTGVALAVTEVNVASVGHEDVPYWCILAQSDDGSFHISKRDQLVRVGDKISLLREIEEDLPIVGVIGTGVMGKSLVEMLVGRGHHVRWVSRSKSSVERARSRVLDRLARVMDDDALLSARERLVASDTPSIVADCDLVIEAVVEDVESKTAALGMVEAAMRADALLATNTSGLPLDDLASALTHPERFGALHFFNPATRMRLVETSRSTKTSDATADALEHLARSFGKVPIRVAPRPAFIVNRVLMPLINEAVRSLEEGAASAADIDEAVRLGLNHPMGPLTLADLIGLDVVVSIMDNISERTGDDTYAPRMLLRSLVAGGKLGRKTGSGFYEYLTEPPRVT